MFLDPKTRAAFPKAHQLFPQQKLPVSACFNGHFPANQQKMVHINPPASVRCTQNKIQLFDKLAQNQRPVPKYESFDSFYEKGIFNAFGVVEAFGDPSTWAEKPLTLRLDGKSSQFHDFSDLLSQVAARQRLPEELKHMEKNGVLMQPKISCPHIAVVTAIPNAASKPLRHAGRIIDNGVLSERTKQEAIMPIIEKVVKEIIDELDLDIATVTVAHDATTLQVVDVDTRFQPQFAEPLLNYIEMLVEAERVRYAKKRK